VAQKASRRKGTRDAYASYLRWAFEHAEIADINMSAPLTERDLCCLLALHARQKQWASHSTLMSALQDWHRRSGFGDLPRYQLYHETQKGFKNLTAHVDVPNRAMAISEENLLAIKATLDLSTLDGARDWAMLLIPFLFLLRAGEYTGSALAWGDTHVHHESKKIEIVVEFSKTSMAPTSVFCHMRGDALCPHKALCNYARRHNEWHGERPKAAAPVFASDWAVPITQAQWGIRLKQLVSRIGLDPAVFSPHSLRRGGATAMFIANVPREDIKSHGRWKSDAIDIYNDARVADRVQAPSRLLAERRPFL
jgi:integrase